MITSILLHCNAAKSFHDKESSMFCIFAEEAWRSPLMVLRKKTVREAGQSLKQLTLELLL